MIKVPPGRWIGFDLDGTLATQKKGQIGIGKPVPKMVTLLRRYLKAGVWVKIFTARAHPSWLVYHIIKASQYTPSGEVLEWLIKNQLPSTLEITCEKDAKMYRLYDDKAIQVRKNTGRIVR